MDNELEDYCPEEVNEEDCKYCLYWNNTEKGCDLVDDGK